MLRGLAKVGAGTDVDAWPSTACAVLLQGLGEIRGILRGSKDQQQQQYCS
jgi:hypothetical protein